MAGKKKRNKKGGASSSQNPPPKYLPSPPAIPQYPPSFPPPFPVITFLPPPPFPPPLIPVTFIPPPPFPPPVTFLPPPPFPPPVTFLPPPPYPQSPPIFPRLPAPTPPPLQIRAPAVNTPPTPIKLVAANSANPEESKYDLYFHSYRVRVMVTSSPNSATNWITTTYQLRAPTIKQGQQVIGIGAQYSTPSGPTTITLCVGPNCLIFHLHNAAFSPPALKKFLADTSFAFVRLDSCPDLYNALAASRYGLVVNRLIDLRQLAVARDYGLADAGMETVADKILGLKGMVVKDEAVEKDTNWEDKKLSEDQVKFATVDAFLCYLMGNNLDASNYFVYGVQHPPNGSGAAA